MCQPLFLPFVISLKLLIIPIDFKSRLYLLYGFRQVLFCDLGVQISKVAFIFSMVSGRSFFVILVFHSKPLVRAALDRFEDPT